MATETAPVHFYLRHEVKPAEKRTPLLPEHAKALLEKGYKVTVEKSKTRCIPDKEYSAVGCELVDSESWPNAPKDAVILGLKELPENGNLIHNHIYFGHAYKNQGGWEELLNRFVVGGGKLWDMENLTHDNGRRVAAFGRSAGSVGMAIGLMAWAAQLLGDKGVPPLLKPYADAKSLAEFCKKEVQDALAANPEASLPKICIIGAKGRCGGGAAYVADLAGIPLENMMLWDIEETKKGGPFPEILKADILVNCILLTTATPPFLTKEMVTGEGERRLRVIVDVSCDTSNPHNPLPFITFNTTFAKPVERLPATDVDFCSIDHMPSFVPLESSREYATALFPYLCEYPSSNVWLRASQLFDSKTEHLRS